MNPEPRLVPDLLAKHEAEFAMDATQDRCALLDENGRIVRVNRPWEESRRADDPVPLMGAVVGTDFLSATGRAALFGNREAGSLHAQLRGLLRGEVDRARLDFERTERSGGVKHCVATLEIVRDPRPGATWVLVAFTESNHGGAHPSGVPEAGFTVPAGAELGRLTKALDALPSHAAILDRRARIVAVNAAWKLFAVAAGGDPEATGVGVNYLAVCERAVESGDPRAAEFARGLGAVLRGVRHTFASDSRVGLGREIRRFRGRATALYLAEGPFVLITHTELAARSVRPAASRAAS
ncbi:MAG: hypothetical protein AAF726_19545 [Planctomycetota bacterium]